MDYEAKQIRDTSREKGRAEGREEGIRLMIEAYQGDGLGKTEVSHKVMAMFQLSEGKMTECMEKYWRDSNAQKEKAV